MIIVSPNALRKETGQLLKTVEAEMEKYESEAIVSRESPFQIKNASGHCGYAELVLAKLSALNTLAVLNEQVKK